MGGLHHPSAFGEDIQPSDTIKSPIWLNPNKMSNQCVMCGNPGQHRVKLPPESAELMIGEPDFETNDVDGPIIAHFCNPHWETCESLVRNYSVNPLLRCSAKYIEEGYADGEFAEKNLIELVSNANTNERTLLFDTRGFDRGVKSKLVLWTLDAVSDAVNTNERRLRYQLFEQLEGQGLAVTRCAESEEADLLANANDGRSNLLFAFKIVGVSPSRNEVMDVGTERRFSLEITDRVDDFRFLANRMGAVPILVFKWADDPRFFIHDLRRDEDSVTIQQPVDGKYGVFEDIQFTPLPTIADLPEVITQDRWEEAVRWRRAQEGAKYDKVREFVARFR